MRKSAVTYVLLHKRTVPVLLERLHDVDVGVKLTVFSKFSQPGAACIIDKMKPRTLLLILKNGFRDRDNKIIQATVNLTKVWLKEKTPFEVYLKYLELICF